jgi:phage gpG-like protein
MATHSNFSSAFKSMYRKLQSTQRTLPSVLANVGTNFFISNFDKEGFQDGGLTKWKTPQRKIAGTKSYKYPKKKDLGRRTRKTLVKSGKLRREVNSSAKEKTFKRIVWRVSLPYAARHNEGLKGMPERRFMGPSRTLNTLFRKKIIEAYKKSLNG